MNNVVSAFKDEQPLPLMARFLVRQTLPEPLSESEVRVCNQYKWYGNMADWADVHTALVNAGHGDKPKVRALGAALRAYELDSLVIFGPSCVCCGSVRRLDVIATMKAREQSGHPFRFGNRTSY